MAIAALFVLSLMHHHMYSSPVVLSPFRCLAGVSHCSHRNNLQHPCHHILCC